MLVPVKGILTNEEFYDTIILYNFDKAVSRKETFLLCVKQHS